VKWRDIFRSDWFLKFISLIFAVLLWFLVGGEEMVQVTISVPLEITNVPVDLVIANDVPPALAVKVYGPRSLINNATKQRISKVIDLRGSHAGRVTIDITPSRLSLPAGVTAMKVDPASVTIVLERRLSRVVPVKAILTGEVENDYELDKVVVEPEQVRISGPESEVAGIRELETYPIELGRATNSFTREIGLNLHGLHITVDGDSIVRVHVEVRPLEGTMRFQHVQVMSDHRAGKLTWWPAEVTVILEGPKPLLKKITNRDIVVKIPKDLKLGKQWLAPDVTVPPGLIVKKTIPETVRITYRNSDK
jgi:YbbR domain-containing protein